MTKSRFIQNEEAENILSDFHAGLNTVQLAEKYGRNDSTIGKLLKKNGFRPRSIKTKLTETQVLEAYEKYEKELWTTEKLGEFYSVDANTIANSFRRYGLEVRPNGWIPSLKDDSFFETIDSEAKAYYLGFIMCDGSIIEDKKHSALHIELQHQDEIWLKQFVKTIGLPEERVRTYTRSGGLTTSKISINSDRFCTNLIDKGIVRKKMGNKQIPLHVPIHLLRHTIRGIIDADGGIYDKTNSVTLSGAGQIVYQVADYLFKEAHLVKKPAIYDNPDIYSAPKMSIHGKEDFQKVIHFLYNNAAFYLERKYPF